MKTVYLVVPKDTMINTGWLNQEDAKQHCYKYNKELESINPDLSEDDRIPEHEVIAVAIQDSADEL